MAAGDAVDSMYMDNLDEFINDENKIVTYRWLSTTLQVHVNQAKQMLYNFVIHQRNGDKEDNLNVTYFVAGLQKNEDSTKIHRCEVVSESNLEAVKSTLQELYSCHIYSVQKSKLQESDALYITDYNLMKENVFESCKQSSIQFDAKRLVAKLESVAPKIKKEVITPSAALLNNDAHQKKSESKEKTTALFKNHGGTKSNKMGNIAGMFAKSNVKKESPKNDDQNQNAEAKSTVKKGSTESKKPSSVMSFFANSSAKTKQSEEKPSITKKESPVVSEKKRTEHKKKPASSDSDDDFVQKKKRRRIKDDLFDSSSEEEEEMETEDPLPSPAAATPDSEDDKKDEEKDEDDKEKDEEEKAESMEDESPIPNTPEQKKVKKEEPAATVQVTSDGRRRKHIKRKKKKTYLNDEGFMVTETVMESDSTDASDAEQPPSNNSNSSVQKKFGPTAVTAKTIADKGKQKQSSLMSFFQKK